MINNEQRCVFLETLISHESLEQIPSISEDSLEQKSTESLIVPQCSAFNSARKSRAFIRLNLASIKANIVSDLLHLFKENPPKPIPTQGTGIEIANRLADAYIDIVDDFLSVHYGAQPKLGWRIEAFGFQNKINAPWCADWAEEVLGQMSERFSAKDPIHQWLRISWSQFHGPEHNFVVVYSRGNPPEMPPPSSSRTLLIFDPWRTITPRTYFPGDPDWSPERVPENLGIKN